MKNPKLKKDEYGDYIYDGRFRISNHGYDRVYGRCRWNVTRIANRRTVFEADTLREAVRRIEVAEGGAE